MFIFSTTYRLGQGPPSPHTLILLSNEMKFLSQCEMPEALMWTVNLIEVSGCLFISSPLHDALLKHLTWFKFTFFWQFHDMIVFFNNLKHKFFILIHLLHSSTRFEHYCARLQEDKIVVIQLLVSSLWTQVSEDIRCCTNTNLSSWRWA